LGIHLLAIMRGQSRPDQRVVVGKQPRVKTFSHPPDQGRGALHVGKQKRQRFHGAA